MEKYGVSGGKFRLSTKKYKDFFTVCPHFSGKIGEKEAKSRDERG
ncbi:hypothetical protein BACCAP_00457 [Pseudoflavonifractor capillosus ATCC 29799]|uniref:Uncharacterized protein n=1 Tax=Pseudoflavonifractor capillosus ATCC 29799 TaxID=411467 RepID=A6NQI7_9FIRM|nr:hypothetical protein BACCAP_00457 [Pseudoflavonifractor capillosus ATCC 29799]